MKLNKLIGTGVILAGFAVTRIVLATAGCSDIEDGEDWEDGPLTGALCGNYPGCGGNCEKDLYSELPANQQCIAGDTVETCPSATYVDETYTQQYEACEPISNPPNTSPAGQCMCPAFDGSKTREKTRLVVTLSGDAACPVPPDEPVDEN